MELKIKCPCDILTEYSNNKTRIFFEFKPGHNKYTLIKKTKEFFLDEINTFKRELIHFFNIDKLNASIFIYLEIEGKKIKSEKKNFKENKLVLSEIINEKKEIICLLYENVELKILIRIINAKEKIKPDKTDIKEDFNIKKRPRVYLEYNGKNNFNKSELSFQDRIKLFNGEFIKKKIYRNENIPGKLKIPEVFLQHNKKNDIKGNKTNEPKKEKEKE